MQVMIDELSESEITAMCEDPSTDPVLLALLVQAAFDGRPGAKAKLLAGNPGVPLEKLFTLAPWCPAELLQNPSFKLHLAIQPGLLGSMSTRARAALVRCPEIPVEWLRNLATSRSVEIRVRCAAARNPNCPPDLMKQYMTRHAWQVRKALARNPALPNELVRTLASDPKASVRAAVAKRSQIEKETLRKLAIRTEKIPVLMAVIANKNAPDLWVKHWFSLCRHPRVREQLIRFRPHLVSDLQLSDHRRWETHKMAQRRIFEERYLKYVDDDL